MTKRILRAQLKGYEDAGQERATVTQLGFLGETLSVEGDQPGARRLLLTGVEKARPVDDQIGLHTCCHYLGRVAVREGKHAEARRLQEESLEIAQRIGLPWGEANARVHLGHALRFMGDGAAATEQYLAALGIAWEMGALAVALECVLGLGLVSWREDPVQARRLVSVAAEHPSTCEASRVVARDLLRRQATVKRARGSRSGLALAPVSDPSPEDLSSVVRALLSTP